jgi:hypothetical protein
MEETDTFQGGLYVDPRRKQQDARNDGLQTSTKATTSILGLDKLAALKRHEKSGVVQHDDQEGEDGLHGVGPGSTVVAAARQPGGTGRNGSTGARTRATLAARAARAVGAIRTSIVGVGMGRRGKGGIATETETDLTIGPTIGRMTDAGEKRDPVIVEMVGGPMIDVVIDVMIDVVIDE